MCTTKEGEREREGEEKKKKRRRKKRERRARVHTSHTTAKHIGQLRPMAETHACREHHPVKR